MEEAGEHRPVAAYRTALATVCAALNAEGARYVVAGGRAMQLWGTSRATRDIDLLIEPMEENGRRVVRALAQAGMPVNEEWLGKELVTRAATVIGDNPKVDVFTVAWTVPFRDAHAAAVRFVLEGVEIPTMSIGHLIESKRTGRLQDAVDIELLEEIRRLREAR